MAKYTFVIHALSRGGAEKVLLTLASGLKSKGHQVKIVLFGEEQALETGDIEVLKLNCSTRGRGLYSPLVLIKLIFNLRRVLKQNADYIVSFGDQNNLITAFAKLFIPGKLIVSDRVYPLCGPLLGGRSPLIRSILTSLRNLLYSTAAAVVVPTEEMRSFYKHHNVKVIPNPVKVPTLSKLSSQSSPVVLAAGRLVEQKRFDLAIEAFSIADTKGWELRIFGDGQLKEELTQLAATQNASKIAVNGASTDLSKEMSEASIFVLSSDFEGFPNVLIEAMAHGLAVVATRCPTGPSSLIVDGINGLLVPCGDKKALSQAIEKLVRDSKFRRELGMRAAETARAFSEERIISSWEKLI
jgi:GalNAc-alpha-(1->4)-GalNAc-alpha-(1->3)-diNAcBac-PP-undecaprenol alpha-1,4-N-acetyl-D-galactosaminyltransferase